MREVTCSWCKGEGTIPDPDHPNDTEIWATPCEVCNGDGKLKINLEVDEE